MPQGSKNQNTGSPVNPLGLLRIRQVLGIVPVSPSTWWAGVRTGRFPKPVKLSPGVTCWRASDVMRLVDGDTPGRSEV